MSLNCKVVPLKLGRSVHYCSYLSLQAKDLKKTFDGMFTRATRATLC